jgi:hypothetical protein
MYLDSICYSESKLLLNAYPTRPCTPQARLQAGRGDRVGELQ